jgi:D-arabinose 1-dehydrogenase-like Zn-dependent alcohol dehydrogenase
MKAVVVHGIEDYRLEERPVPQVGPGEVLVRIGATGVCASDVTTYYSADRVRGSEQFEPYIETPVTPGHEFVGEVAALGEGAAEKYGLALGVATVVMCTSKAPARERECSRGYR